MKKILIASLIGIICILSLCTKPDSYFRARVVKLQGKQGMCSGEQIRAPSGVDYILSAAHCRAFEQDGKILVTTEDGKQMPRRVIEEDAKSDLLLLEGIPGLKGLDIAKSSYRHQHVRAFTHGSNLDTWKTEGEIVEIRQIKVPITIILTEEEASKCLSMEKNKIIEIETFFEVVKVCALDVEEAVTTAKIVPGSSGGMLVDDSGDLVGVASASDGTFGMLVTTSDINNFLSSY